MNNQFPEVMSGKHVVYVCVFDTCFIHWDLPYIMECVRIFCRQMILFVVLLSRYVIRGSPPGSGDCCTKVAVPCPNPKAGGAFSLSLARKPLRSTILCLLDIPMFE